MRNADFGLRNGDHEKESRFDRLTADESRTTQKRIGQTNPPRRKPKAAIETGRALPHVADGSARLWPEASATTRESRTTAHESRFDKLTAGAKPQWPNKAICSQSQGRKGERPRVALYG